MKNLFVDTVFRVNLINNKIKESKPAQFTKVFYKHIRNKIFPWDSEEQQQIIQAKLMD